MNIDIQPICTHRLFITLDRLGLFRKYKVYNGKAKKEKS